MGKPESRIEKKLCEGVKSLGGRAYKFVSPGASGVPDRVVCLPNGRVIFAELKSQRGVLSKQQLHRIEELRRMGQRVYVLNSEERVGQFLSKIREELSNEIHTP